MSNEEQPINFQNKEFTYKDALERKQQHLLKYGDTILELQNMYKIIKYAKRETEIKKFCFY